MAVVKISLDARGTVLVATVARPPGGSPPMRKIFAVTPAFDLGLGPAGAARPDLVSFAEAERFISLYYGENPAAGPAAPRLREVRGQLESTGTYRHTRAELEFAARVAWRNSSRCIGRLYWPSLRLRDRRHVVAADEGGAEGLRP